MAPRNVMGVDPSTLNYATDLGMGKGEGGGGERGRERGGEGGRKGERQRKNINIDIGFKIPNFLGLLRLVLKKNNGLEREVH